MSCPRRTVRTASGPLRASTVLVAVLVGLLLLVGCSNAEPTLPAVTRTPDASGTVRVAPDGVQEITLETGDDYAFTPKTFAVHPGRVRLTVRNTAKALTHNFTFTPNRGPAPISEQIPILAPGASETIEFAVTTPGDYPFECSFHAALGQVGTMTVSG